jgi:hypothetical protein
MNSQEYQLSFPENISRRCPDCGLEKPASEFRRNNSRPDGLSFYCKPCFKSRDAAGYRRRRNAQGHAVRERIDVPDGTKCCARCRDIKPLDAFALAPRQPGGRNCYCKDCNNARQRETHTLRKYGLSQQEVDELIESQGGVCAICQYRPAKHVDHDHVTGVVRGVLCFPCNAALGHFKDRIDLLMRAARYLETSTWQKSRICTGVFRLTSPRPARRPSSTSSALQHLISSHRAAVTSPPV